MSSLKPPNLSLTILKNLKLYARCFHAQIHSELPYPELVISYIRLFNFILIVFIFNIRYLALPSAAHVAHLSMISHIGSIISRVFSGSIHYRLFRSLWISTGLTSTPWSWRRLETWGNFSYIIRNASSDVNSSTIDNKKWIGKINSKLTLSLWHIFRIKKLKRFTLRKLKRSFLNT